MLKNKNIQNPAAMAEVFDLSCLSRLFEPESKLSHDRRATHGFVPTLGALRRLTLQELSHPSGKNIKKFSGSNQWRSLGCNLRPNTLRTLNPKR
jgi:hypothetical protein